MRRHVIKWHLQGQNKKHGLFYSKSPNGSSDCCCDWVGGANAAVFPVAPAPACNPEGHCWAGRANCPAAIKETQFTIGNSRQISENSNFLTTHIGDDSAPLGLVQRVDVAVGSWWGTMACCSFWPNSNRYRYSIPTPCPNHALRGQCYWPPEKKVLPERT